MLALRQARLRARSAAAVIGAVLLLFLAPSLGVAGHAASLAGADGAVANAIGPGLDTAFVGAAHHARLRHSHTALPGAMLFLLPAVPALAGPGAGRGTPVRDRLPDPQAAPAPRPPRGPPAFS
jgi:hypothetical protein